MEERTNSKTLNTTLDDIMRLSNIGTMKNSISNSLYGINHLQDNNYLPANKDHMGFTFFTRPQLNLMADNISNYPPFYDLLDSRSTSYQTWLRCTLDPRLQYGYIAEKLIYPKLSCALCDPHQAFISILTQNIISMTGWPDKITTPFISQEGLYKETYIQADGVTRDYKDREISATFRNQSGNPIVRLFNVWRDYTTLVLEGLLVPYPDFLISNTIDYMTRCYRITLSSTKEYVTNIGAFNVGFPLNVPIGGFMDFNVDKPYNDQIKDITIMFLTSGVEYSSLLIYDFNEVVCIFNPDMRDNFRNQNMILLDQSISKYFKNRVYPRINPNDHRMEWWVPKDLYNQRTAAFLAANYKPQTQDEQNLGD